ncbi:hypothetical protein GCT13_37840 [Paraburkholderia sp. CNPSo 3157]|uniref:Uncharacterized protein n=1 Tax=Paraburkholderia franconis TaxID=2654983 RepID=A0A7X1TKI3_9BURK|nr:hypothetical protein [Paraburkholderia franconis]MPW22438.1 hypothetical protein [Paraburkholderia franconis]
MTINLTNWASGLTLEFGSASASEGPAPQAQPGTIGYGQPMRVSAVNRSGGCVGRFSLMGNLVTLGVSYYHPSGPGSTTVTFDATTGYITGANALTFPGHDSVAALNFYRAINANNRAWVVPLGLLDSPARNNCQDFVNSLFGENTRNAAVVTGAYENAAPDGYVEPADFTGDQMQAFAAQWAQQWINGGTNPACPPQDAALIAMLARYVSSAASNGPLTMWVPQIKWQAGTNPSVFALNGYRAYPFSNGNSWNAASVTAFVNLLAAGAHFVAISAIADLPAGVEMKAFDDFFAASGLPTRHDPGNSHYATVTNITGTYYLDVSADFAPENCGLILAFLAGRTVNNPLAGPGTYNTFVQLEGWQAGTQRHGIDYDTFKQTLWNISTFGACPYSEKRATTVFLAPQGWTPQLYQTTRMMPYVGAYGNSNGTPQAWLNTDVVTIPPDAPPLPSRYIG